MAAESVKRSRSIHWIRNHESLVISASNILLLFKTFVRSCCISLLFVVNPILHSDPQITISKVLPFVGKHSSLLALINHCHLFHSFIYFPHSIYKHWYQCDKAVNKKHIREVIRYHFTAVNEGLSGNFKLIGQKMIIIAGKSSLKLVKRGSLEKIAPQIAKIWIFKNRNFIWKPLEITLGGNSCLQQRFSYKISIFENSYLRNLWSDLFQTSHFY